MINTIINDDCRNVIPRLKKQYKNIVFVTDPPYNIEFKNYDNYEDNLSDKDYIDLLACMKGNSAAVIQYPEEIMKYVVPALGIPLEVLAWCYSSNLPKQFRLVNIYQRRPDFSKVIQPYKNPTDPRIRQRIADGNNGTAMYDWFDDIQLVKNVSKEKSIHPCPVSIRLMQRLIKILTTEEDIIVDPFLGSGTTAIASIKEQRSYIGIEKSEVYFKIAKQRVADYLEGSKDMFIENGWL
jgi:DNA modification methylase